MNRLAMTASSIAIVAVAATTGTVTTASAATVPTAKLVNTAQHGPVGGATTLQAKFPAGSRTFHLQSLSKGKWVNVPKTSKNKTGVASSTSSGVVVRGHFARVWGRSSLRLTGVSKGHLLHTTTVKVAGYKHISLFAVMKNKSFLPAGSTVATGDRSLPTYSRSVTTQPVGAVTQSSSYKCSSMRIGNATTNSKEVESGEYSHWKFSRSSGAKAITWNAPVSATGVWKSFRLDNSKLTLNISTDYSAVDFAGDAYCTR